MNKEKIILAALKLPEYERKQIALVLLASMLNDIPRKAAISIVDHIAATTEAS